MTMLLALETPQLLMMILSFVGMAACLGFAAWMLRRPRGDERLPPPPAGTQPPNADSPPPDKTEFVPVHRGVAIADDGAPPEKTEFVALADDGPPPEKTEFVPAHRIPAIRDDGPPPEKTEFVPAHRIPAIRDDGPPPEKTEFIPSPAAAMRDDGPPPEKTEFIPSPAIRDDGPPPEKTAFIPAPPRFAPPSEHPLAPPPAEPTAFVRAVPSPAPAPASHEDLEQHLQLAADALAAMHADASASATNTLAGHLAVLAAKPAAALVEFLRPRLQKEIDAQWYAACLALLQSKQWPAKTALPELLESLDPPRRDAALRTLQSWDDPRAESLAHACLAGASSTEVRAMWLRCFAERGWDPGSEAIAAALDDADPGMIALGLRLLPHAPAELHDRASSNMFAGDPGVRTQAIEAALVLADPRARLLCMQLARNPKFPAIAELAGLIGSEREVVDLCGALRGDANPTLLRGLGLSGRPAVLRECVERFGDPDPALRDAAREALTLAAGTPFADADEARAWLDGHANATRLLGGATRDATQLLAVLARSDEGTRSLLGRELLIRSKGQIRLADQLLPWAFARELARVREAVGLLDLGL